MRLAGVISKFKKEQKRLQKDLAQVETVLAALEKGVKKSAKKVYRQSAAAKKAISRAQKKRWKKVKQALAAKS
jgi:hypothetical protein